MKKAITVLTAVLCLAMTASGSQSVPEFSPAQTPMQQPGQFPMTQASAIARSESSADVTITPAQGSVSSLKEFTVTFSDAETVTRGNVTYGNAPTVHRTGDPDGNKQFCFTMSFEGNTMTLSVSAEISEEGDWTLTLPAGFYLIDGTEQTETLEFDYTVSPVIIEDGQIIYEAPAGEKVECMTFVQQWFVLNGMLAGMPLAGKPMHYILTDDDCIYVYNPIVLSPFTGTQMNSYIKGVKDGDDYLFTFPQPVYEETVEGETKIWYVNNLKMEIYEDGGSDYVLAGNNTFRMKINSDGSLESSEPINPEGGSENIVGTMTDGKWNGFGCTKMRYDIMNYTTSEVPSDLETNDAEMKYENAENQPSSTFLKIGIADNDIWVKGFGIHVLPDAWVHGTIDGETVTFDSFFMGLSEQYGQYVFLRGCTYDNEEGGLELYIPTFNFDRENMVMTCTTNLTLNPNNVFAYPFEQFQHCTITFENDDPSLTTRVPAPPTQITKFEAVEGIAGKYAMSVEITNMNIDGQPLNEDRLRYQVILSDETVYTFQPYRYPASMPVTEIPYNSDYTFIQADGNSRSFDLYDIENGDDIGVRMVYKDATGTYYSDVRLYSMGGIDGVFDSSEIVSTEWFDMTGRRISNPQNGIFIRRDLDSKGMASITKTYLK